MILHTQYLQRNPVGQKNVHSPILHIQILCSFNLGTINLWSLCQASIQQMSRLSDALDSEAGGKQSNSQSLCFMCSVDTLLSR